MPLAEGSGKMNAVIRRDNYPIRSSGELLELLVSAVIGVEVAVMVNDAVTDILEALKMMPLVEATDGDPNKFGEEGFRLVNSTALKIG